MQRVVRATIGLVALGSVFCMSGASAFPELRYEGAHEYSGPSTDEAELVSRQLPDPVGAGSELMELQASVTRTVEPESRAESSAESFSADPVRTSHTSYMSSLTGGRADIPALVLRAYRQAADTWNQRQPECGVRWQILAGIGKVESSHTRGGQATESGDTQPRIYGPVLNGGPGIRAIHDSDGGRWDADTVWDRAVGPMQFIPGTWEAFGVDATGDGVADPHNLFDATLAAARYLCAGGADLSTSHGLDAALRRYNNSAAYVRRVKNWIDVYDGQQVRGVPGRQPGIVSVGDRPGAPASPEPDDEESSSPEPPEPTKTPKPQPDPPTEPAPSDPPRPAPTKTAEPTRAPEPEPTDEPEPEPTGEPEPEPTTTPECPVALDDEAARTDDDDDGAQPEDSGSGDELPPGELPEPGERPDESDDESSEVEDPCGNAVDDQAGDHEGDDASGGDDADSPEEHEGSDAESGAMEVPDRPRREETGEGVS